MAIIISYSTSVSGMIVLLKTIEKYSSYILLISISKTNQKTILRRLEAVFLGVGWKF